MAKTLFDLSQTVKEVSIVPQQPNFMPIQRSIESEQIFQRIMKRSVCNVSLMEKSNVEEVCEIVTRSGRILKEKEVEKNEKEKRYC